MSVLKLHAVLFDMDGLMLDTERIAQQAGMDACADHGFVMDRTLANAAVYLEAFGHTVIAWMWLRAATIAARRLEGVPAKELRGTADAIKQELGSGVVALVSLGLVLVTPNFDLGSDATLGLAWASWGLLKDSLKMGLLGVPRHVDEGGVRDYLMSLPGVTVVHDLHIWGMSTTESALTAHLVMPGGHPGDAMLHEIAHQLEDSFGIHHTTIQVERNADECHLHH